MINTTREVIAADPFEGFRTVLGVRLSLATEALEWWKPLAVESLAILFLESESPNEEADSLLHCPPLFSYHVQLPKTSTLIVRPVLALLDFERCSRDKPSHQLVWGFRTESGTSTGDGKMSDNVSKD